MSEYHRCCPLCREWGWFGHAIMGEHKCKPEWECRGAWEDDPDAEWQQIHASDSEDAAEKFAERYDCDGGEYSIISNHLSDAIVYVRKPLDFEDDPIGPRMAEQFEISAESVPTYRAWKV